MPDRNYGAKRFLSAIFMRMREQRRGGTIHRFLAKYPGDKCVPQLLRVPPQKNAEAGDGQMG